MTHVAGPFVVEEQHLEEIRVHLEEYVGLEHIRLGKEADLLLLESTLADGAFLHARFRRIGDDRWQIEIPAKRGGGNWDSVPLSIQLLEAIDIVIKDFTWTLAPRR